MNLDSILKSTEAAIEKRRARAPLAEVRSQAQRRIESSDHRSFVDALRLPGLSVIAEFKRRSPSVPEIQQALPLSGVVETYQRAGAAALSILTENEYFGGSVEDLGLARGAADLPILRKDFIVDPYQVYEASAAGADAILLIVAAVKEDGRLAELYQLAADLELSTLVEIRSEEELERAAELGADVIGINNRDLASLDVDIETTFRLLKEIPDGTTVVAESGFSERSQLERLVASGVDAVLIGHALVGAADVRAKFGDLVPPSSIAAAPAT